MPRYIRSRTPTDEQAPPVGLKAGRKELSMLPSEIKLKSYYGYHRNIFEGWQKLPDATITAEGYTVEFSRLSERTIDRMCDALNGWYNIWTKFCCEYTDGKGTLSITVRKPEAAPPLHPTIYLSSLSELIFSSSVFSF